MSKRTFEEIRQAKEEMDLRLASIPRAANNPFLNEPLLNAFEKVLSGLKSFFNYLISLTASERNRWMHKTFARVPTIKSVAKSTSNTSPVQPELNTAPQPPRTLPATPKSVPTHNGSNHKP